MGLKLKVNSSLDYVRAVSGLFINGKSPSGITSNEIILIAKLIEHSNSGLITFSVRKKVMTDLDIKNQNFYNAMVILRKKGIIEKSWF